MVEGAEPLDWSGFAELAVLTGGPVETPDLLEDARLDHPHHRTRVPHADCATRGTCLPLRVDDETVGVLAVGDVTGRVFDG